MRIRRWPSLLLAVVLLTLSPVAYSDVPDPVWLGGYYDGSEADDALADLQLHQSAIVVLATYPAPSTASVQLPPPRVERVPPDRPLPATQTRAPPIS